MVKLAYNEENSFVAHTLQQWVNTTPERALVVSGWVARFLLHKEIAMKSIGLLHLHLRGELTFV